MQILMYDMIDMMQFLWILGKCGRIDVLIQIRSMEQYLVARGSYWTLLNCIMRAISHAREKVFMHQALLAKQATQLAMTINTLIWICHNKGSSLARKYEQSYAMQDLDEAIKYTSLACRYTPHDHPSRSRRLNGLAICFAYRFERIGAMEDIDAAMYLNFEAIRSASPSSHDFSTYLNSMGGFHAMRYQHIGDVNDLERAISLTKSAIRVAQAHSIDSADAYSNLGVMMSWKYEWTGNRDDFREALQHSKLAISTPRDRPGRATSISNLADLLSSSPANFEYEHIDNREESLGFYYEVWFCETAPPMVRLKAAQKAADNLNCAGKWKESSEILSRAVSLLSKVSSRSLSQIDQQYVLREFAALGTLAASVMLEAGEDVLHALRVLEVGRGVIASLNVDRREETQGSLWSQTSKKQTSNAGVLKENSQDSMKRLLETKDNIDWMNYGEQSARSETDDGRLSYEDDSLLLAQLKETASSGPLVIINESPIRCDAILVRHDGLTLVNLPALRSHEIATWNRCLRTTSSVYNSKNVAAYLSQQRKFLEWMWHVAAFPILDALKIVPKPVHTQWPRVWWILTGQLSQVPIHAAGRHNGRLSESVMDMVVSSYSPSVGALRHSQRNFPDSRDSKLDRLVVVSMEKTPNLPPLHFATEEVLNVASLLKCPFLTALMNPTKREVLDHIPGANVFHFAGHGKPNAVDPLRTCLVLKDWQQDPLTVQDFLSRERGRDSRHFLAYLSACGTGLNLAHDLQDESINLMYAFQIAGFRHTIGSLWDVGDAFAVEIAIEFYKELSSAEKITDYTVATSAHHAARKLRNQRCRETDEDFLSWAAYIHSGP